MADQSFNDIRTAVRYALEAEDKDKGDDLCVCDLGPDWVVYEDPDTDGPGMCRRTYRMDGETAVLTSDPVKVNKVTSYEPVSEPKTLREAADRTRKAYAEARKGK